MSEQFGTDIKLLQNLDSQSSRNPGNDLKLRERDDLTSQHPLVDFDLCNGNNNLKQALLLRFLTSVGELAELGHPEYGSRLTELIGTLNNETTRNRAKLYTLQAIAMEPRIAEVISLEIRTGNLDQTQLLITMTLRAIDSNVPINLVFPLNLAGG